mmetsp:Transcript_28440/g.80350  ORF Transcript_28440/g.80350 Transcript_28440/m.80350 type:complete len:229 (+) Transcript_28440:2002-2688(+)
MLAFISITLTTSRMFPTSSNSFSAFSTAASAFLKSLLKSNTSARSCWAQACAFLSLVDLRSSTACSALFIASLGISSVSCMPTRRCSADSFRRGSFEPLARATSSCVAASTWSLFSLLACSCTRKSSAPAIWTLSSMCLAFARASSIDLMACSVLPSACCAPATRVRAAIHPSGSPMSSNSPSASMPAFSAISLSWPDASHTVAASRNAAASAFLLFSCRASVTDLSA